MRDQVAATGSSSKELPVYRNIYKQLSTTHVRLSTVRVDVECNLCSNVQTHDALSVSSKARTTQRRAHSTMVSSSVVPSTVFHSLTCTAKTCISTYHPCPPPCLCVKVSPLIRRYNGLRLHWTCCDAVHHHKAHEPASCICMLPNASLPSGLQTHLACPVSCAIPAAASSTPLGPRRVHSIHSIKLPCYT